MERRHTNRLTGNLEAVALQTEADCFLRRMALRTLLISLSPTMPSICMHTLMLAVLIGRSWCHLLAWKWTKVKTTRGNATEQRKIRWEEGGVHFAQLTAQHQLHLYSCCQTLPHYVFLSTVFNLLKKKKRWEKKNPVFSITTFIVSLQCPLTLWVQLINQTILSISSASFIFSGFRFFLLELEYKGLEH